MWYSSHVAPSQQRRPRGQCFRVLPSPPLFLDLTSLVEANFVKRFLKRNIYRIPLENQNLTPLIGYDSNGNRAMFFELTNTVFAAGEHIPTKYTCDGEDISPPLEWTDPLEDTQSFALIADDPDAPVGTWVHWVLYNLPAETRALAEAVPPEAELADE